MTSPKPLLALLGAIALAGVVTSARADTAPSCDGASPREAQQLAREAQKSGAYQRAADCFLVAGDRLRAHRAMIRAAADSSAVAQRNAAATAESVKSQMQRLRAAFR